MQNSGLTNQETGSGTSSARPLSGMFERADTLSARELRDRGDLHRFPRLARLRRLLLDARMGICVERARLMTEYFMSNGFDRSRPVLRQARALAHVLENLTPTLFDQELIVGSTTSFRVGMVVYPEFMSLTIWPELPTISTRDQNPLILSDEDGDLLANVIFPFWKDLTIIEQVRKDANNPEFLRLMERLIFYVLTKANGIGHIIPDFEALVNRGMTAMIQDAALAAAATDDPVAREYHQAVELSLSGVIRLAERYAEACEAEAEKCEPARARELRAAAAALRHAPRNPARTLQEALQAIWITQVALHQENSNMAMSFGRLDQYLAPFYERDLAEGRISRDQAQELIGCFFLKLGDHMPLAPLAGQDIIGGASTDQAVTIGGMKPDGTDGTNELSYIMLELSAMLALREPNVCARLHKGAPVEYRKAVVKSLYQNGAAPALYGDEQIIHGLHSNGVALEHARDYGIIGCVEPTSCGRTMGMTGAIMFNLASAMELALHNGVHPLSGMRVGPATGDLADFQTFDEFYAAFQAQVEHLADLATEGNKWFTRAHAELHPSPLLSSLIQGTRESGRDVTWGGAMYNSSGVGVIGLADVVDSLAAVKALVFEQQQVSMEQLHQALVHNFEGHEKLLARIQSRAPRYGTDNPAADTLAVKVVRTMHETFTSRPHPRGGRYHVGYWSVTMHSGLGAMIGAMPSGRRRGATLASGATPVSGAAIQGPTAAFASTRSLPSECMANNVANNHKLSRSYLGRPGRLEVFEALVRGYFEGGGMQAQFIIQDKDTLMAARDNPDQYRDLLVRVSGYTAYFVDLDRRMQDEIITRTEDVF